MRKFILRSVGFLLVISIVYFIGIGIYGVTSPQAYKKNLAYHHGGDMLLRLSEADTTKNVDIVVAGSSHIYRGIDPRVFARHGLRLFNLGSSSQTPIQSEYLLRKYIDKFNPRLVICEAGFINFGFDGGESNTNLYSNLNVIDLPAICMAFRVNTVKSYNTLTYALFRQVFGLGDKEEPKTNCDTYIPGGFVEICGTGTIHDKYETGKMPLLKRQTDAFRRIVVMLQERHIPMVIIQPPVMKKRYNSVTNMEDFERFFLSFGQPYYNFNNYPGLFTDDDFYDSNHLRVAGADKLSEMFADTIIARHYLSKNTGK